MPLTTVNLSPENTRKLEVFASQTGKSQDDLVNEAVERLDVISPVPAADDWKAAWRQAAGMWQDRDDLPDFQDVRRSWDRTFSEDGAP
jgi:predicted transcriptional regulator